MEGATLAFAEFCPKYLYLNKKLLVKNFGTPTVKVFQLCRF